MLKWQTSFQFKLLHMLTLSHVLIYSMSAEGDRSASDQLSVAVSEARPELHHFSPS